MDESLLKEPLINSSARLPARFVNDFVTVSRRSPAAPSSHFLVIRKMCSAIAQTHLISVSLKIGLKLDQDIEKEHN